MPPIETGYAIRVSYRHYTSDDVCYHEYKVFNYSAVSEGEASRIARTIMKETGGKHWDWYKG